MLGDTVRHFANVTEQAADRSQVCCAHMNLMKLTNGFETGGPDGKDENGYPTVDGIPGGSLGGRGLCKILDIPHSYAGRVPWSGSFRFYWRGGGQLRSNVMPDIDTDANTYPALSIRGGQTWFYQDFTWEPKRPKQTSNVQVMAPPATGQMFHDMAIVHSRHIADWESGLNIPPELVELCAKFDGLLRFMTHIAANLLSNVGDPEERYVTTDHANFTKGEHEDLSSGKFKIKTWPIECLVELCNRSRQGMWYNLPVDITDDRVRSLMTYIRDHLDPDLEIWLEYGNELWNSAQGFQNFGWCREAGKAKFPSIPEGNSFSLISNWAAYRINRIAPLVEAVFSGSGRSAKWVMGASATGATDYGGQLYFPTHAPLEPDWDVAYAPAQLFNFYAVGMYFGGLGGEMADWLDSQHGREILPKVRWYESAFAGADTNGYTALGRNTFPRPIGTLDNPAVRTDVPVNHTIFVGHGASDYAQETGDSTVGQVYLTPDGSSPDETSLWRIDRSADPVALQFNMESYTGTTLGWVTVLTWEPGTQPPTLRDMSLSAQILAFGDDDGWNGQLHKAKKIRIDNHVDLIAMWGSSMQLVAYECGVGDDGTGTDVGDTSDRFAFEIHYGDHERVMYEWYRAFIAHANSKGVHAMAWYKLTSRDHWEPGVAPSGDSRGLIRRLPLPKPDSLLPLKLRAVLGPSL